jgi:hypothetical protein
MLYYRTNFLFNNNFNILNGKESIDNGYIDNFENGSSNIGMGFLDNVFSNKIEKKLKKYIIIFFYL